MLSLFFGLFLNAPSAPAQNTVPDNYVDLEIGSEFTGTNEETLEIFYDIKEIERAFRSGLISKNTANKLNERLDKLYDYDVRLKYYYLQTVFNHAFRYAESLGFNVVDEIRLNKFNHKEMYAHFDGPDLTIG
jgi:hypothetical protein